MNDCLFTSESVSEGHPDKLADQISDTILDAALTAAGERVRQVRCAVETLVKGDLLVIAGEITTPVPVGDYAALARQVAHDIGYGDPALGFDPAGCHFVDGITVQSPDIAQGVGTGEVEGAGDQGQMFGYACEETSVLMPLPVTLAHRLVRRQASLRHAGATWLRPDAKSQITLRYVDGKPQAVTDVVLSTQHAEEIDGVPYTKVLREFVIEEVIKPVLAAAATETGLDHADCRYLVNPTGKFVVGGPQADTGLTGRKIVVDTYGGSVPHGGGAFSGKDPSKVDRSAAYAARHIAKNIVAAGVASECLLQLSYAIGHAQPVSLMVDTRGTGKVGNEALVRRIKDRLDLSPAGIISNLRLCRPLYRKTAAYGHFGRDDLDLPWEDTSGAKDLFGDV